jgi:hypothetical protein
MGQAWRPSGDSGGAGGKDISVTKIYRAAP